MRWFLRIHLAPESQAPTFVSPASTGEQWIADQYVGDADTPWSITNLAYGLFDTLEMAPPSGWPEMQEVGTALSWTCYQNVWYALDGGIYIEDGQSIRCLDKSCGAFEWHPVKSVDAAFVSISPIPEQFQKYTEVEGFDHFAHALCQAGWSSGK